jgi:hypothetical protein
LPVQKLHRDEGVPVLFTDVVDCADVGMVQRRRGLRLSLEPGERLWVSRHFLRQELQRHEAVQAGVLGFVHHPMPPPSFSMTR